MDMLDLMKIGGLTLFFLATAILVWSLLPREGGPVQARDPFPDQGGDQASAQAGDAGLIRVLWPVLPLLSPLAARLPLTGYRARLGRYLTTAGIERLVDPDRFMAFQAAMLLVFLLLGLLWKPQWGNVLLFGLAGCVYPYWWLVDRRKARQTDILSTMPDMVDMLALSTAAGLDFQAGIKRICDTHPGRNPFVDEMRILYQNVRLGMSVDQALDVMASRVDSLEVHSFCSILVQAQKMGASIADVLKAQAGRMRQERFMRAERAGATASQKLLVPMMIFLFPVIFIVIFGPYLLKFLYNR